eukprot:TRINITY_DN3826_c0_g1_i1.p1 TRINITY_DN3826_c0_g1~~TRINITY_DN3826_c0_g1_i1.p1  ORF type:complete len:545 (+),score=131.18 TRINITY_DN3826_c0_g1_i1:461-2095(+)
MFDFLSLKSLLTGQRLEDAKNKQNLTNEDGTWRFERDTEVKLVVLGARGAGKTSIVNRFTLNAFPPKTTPTIGLERSQLRLAHNNPSLNNLGDVVSLSILEVAQPEVKGNHCNSIFENADGIMFVVDAADQKTGLAIDQWMLMIGNRAYCSPRIPKCVLVNKADQKSQMTPAFISSLVSRNGLCFAEMVSAKSGKGVTEAFHRFVDEVLEIKSAQVEKLKKRSSGPLTGFKRYELEVMEAMTQELEHEQMPIGVYNPTPTLSGSSSSSDEMLSMSDEKNNIAVDLSSTKTTEILKQLMAEAKKSELMEDDVFNVKKRQPAAPELSESILLLNSVHSFYQKLQYDLTYISNYTNEDRKPDLDKLEKQRSTEYVVWQKQLSESEKTAQKIDFLKSTFTETVSKWDRLIESLSVESTLSRSAGTPVEHGYEFGFMTRSKKLFSKTPEVSPVGSLSLGCSLPNMTVAQSGSASSSLSKTGSATRSMGFGFRNAGRASPNPKSSHSSPKSTPSSSTSTSPRGERIEMPFSNYYEQTLLAALAHNAVSPT